MKTKTTHLERATILGTGGFFLTVGAVLDLKVMMAGGAWLLVLFLATVIERHDPK